MTRRSFLPPVPEFELAADLLAQAADALLSKNFALCERYLREADFPALRAFAYRVCGSIDPEIHRQSKNPVYVRPPLRAEARMQSAEVTRTVYARDGYRCRYCSSRIILQMARKVFIAACPGAARWGRTNLDKHFGLATLAGSIDNIVPFKWGGGNEPTNLVTACGPCQFGRNQWTLEEVQIEDPFKHPPIVNGWDGLSRLIGLKLVVAPSAHGVKFAAL